MIWFVDSGVCFRLVMTLLHFVWQAAILGLVAHIATHLLRRRDPQHAYSVNVAVLMVMVLTVVATFMHIRAPIDGPNTAPVPYSALNRQAEIGARSEPIRNSTVVPRSTVAVSETARVASKERFTIVEWAPHIAACYVFIATIMLLRLSRGVWQTCGLRRSAIQVQCDELLNIARNQARLIGLVVTPAIAWCEEISVPIVTGVVRPMILLPAAFINGMTPQQMEAILAHEMAHIRRFDLPFNLLQRIVESVLFFHPAVWLVSRRIDIEREKTADDCALRSGCDPARYADSLLRMVELSNALRQGVDPGTEARLSLAASGTHPSELRGRILRLIKPESRQLSRARLLTPTTLIAATVVALLTTLITVNGALVMAADEQSDSPTQELRDQFAAAIESNDVGKAEQLLADEPLLANADLRSIEHRNDFSQGHPLHLACQHNHGELAELLLKHGAHPDAPGRNPDNRPVHGMPLHFAAADHRDYRLANVLLDYGATPNSHPNCDKATIERMFYQAREAGLSDSIVRRAYANYLPDRSALISRTVSDLVGDASEEIKLFARMIDLGGQPPFCAIVREGFDDLVLEIAEHSQDEDGTPHDHPNSNAINNISGAARWYGYPTLVRRLMEHPSYRYNYGSVIDTIGVAIGSHNRDGDFSAYREIIVMQLEQLKSHDDLERAQQDPDFKPIYHIATDFTWHENYGYRAEIARPECYIDLAELFVSWGFDDINYRDTKTGHSPLSAAVKRGHHPGIATYIRWLLDKGADLRESDPDDVNPKAIAIEKGHDEIWQILAS